MIAELFEEDPQEDQPENSTLPEPEVEVTVGDQPDKPTQSMENMMRMIMEAVSYTHLQHN